MSRSFASRNHAPHRIGILLLIAILAVGAMACSRAPATASPAKASADAPTKESAGAPAKEAAGAGEAFGGDEPTVAFVDGAGGFALQHPRSWGKATQSGEGVRFAGADEFISVTVTTTQLDPMAFAKSDAAELARTAPGYKGEQPKAYKVARQSGAMVAYTWQAGPSPVTGKPVPSSANRYYIPGPGGKLAIFTYSGPTRVYDPEGADDFANAFKWLGP